jgi:hypothetical protein
MNTSNAYLAAVEAGDIERVRALREAKVPIDNRALWRAVDIGNSRMVEALLFAGADPDAEIPDGA